MKTQLDLTQMGLIEMNSKEMEEIEGGGLFGFIIGFVVGAAVALLSGEEAAEEMWFGVACAAGMIGLGLPI